MNCVHKRGESTHYKKYVYVTTVIFAFCVVFNHCYLLKWRFPETP